MNSITPNYNFLENNPIKDKVIIEITPQERKIQDIAKNILNRYEQLKIDKYDESNTISKNTWSVEDNLSLIMLVNQPQEELDWDKISQNLNKTVPECQYQWENILDPSIKVGDWNQEEDMLLKNAILACPYKNDWKTVSRYVPDRSPQQCFLRFKNLIKDKKTSKELLKPNSLFYLNKTEKDNQQFFTKETKNRWLISEDLDLIDRLYEAASKNAIEPLPSTAETKQLCIQWAKVQLPKNKNKEQCKKRWGHLAKHLGFLRRKTRKDPQKANMQRKELFYKTYYNRKYSLTNQLNISFVYKS